MTAQITDSLHYDGEQYRLQAEPLEVYFKQNPPRPSFEEICTACWRGYVATWRIKNSKLHLEKIENFDGKDHGLMRRLFPDQIYVVATWYTGPLICPSGPEVNYVHMGYMTTYEKYMIIEIEKGEVVSVKDLSLDEFKQWCRKRFKEGADRM